MVATKPQGRRIIKGLAAGALDLRAMWTPPAWGLSVGQIPKILHAMESDAIGIVVVVSTAVRGSQDIGNVGPFELPAGVLKTRERRRFLGRQD